jgi:hypothetical protein
MTNDWSSSLSKPDLFEKFKQQVNKDFELSGLLTEAPLIVSNELAHIQQAFSDAIHTIESKAGSGIQNLLYRIDISETQIRQMVQEYPNKPMHDIIVELMIKRILQKVVLKDLYS